MENEDKIQLPLKLGLIIKKYLKSKYDIETDYKMFSREHLELIKKLEIVQPTKGCLEGVELLPNLKSLKIETLGNSFYIQPSERKSISDKDLIYIEKCENLTDLEIINQANITYLDVEKMDKLKGLTVTNNMNLQEIDGLESLENVWDFTCYGNEKLENISGMSEMIKKNSHLNKLELDVLLFPKAIDYTVRNGKYDEKTIERLKEIPNVLFSEVVGKTKTKINLNQMIGMHNKACKILEENNITGNDLDVIVGIETYIAQNIEYDHDSLKHGHSATSNGIVSGPVKGANGAYNGLMDNKCVCEGYTRAEQYLLGLKGIASHNVHCIAEQDTLHMSDAKKYNEQDIDIGFTMRIAKEIEKDRGHSIICIDDFKKLYSDPCWNARRYQRGDKSMPWLLKTKEEISKDHMLSFGERDISICHESKEIIEEKIKNSLFIANKTRVGAVRDTQTEIGKIYKGQIIEREEQKI